jgi:hypothetical protein
MIQPSVYCYSNPGMRSDRAFALRARACKWCVSFVSCVHASGPAGRSANRISGRRGGRRDAQHAVRVDTRALRKRPRGTAHARDVGRADEQHRPRARRDDDRRVRALKRSRRHEP